jgi:tetratricopeptide (TPR) repeat protein
VNKPPYEELPGLGEDELEVIDQLAKKLPHHSLKGHFARTEYEVLALDTEDVDLARGLFLSQLEAETDSLIKTRNYEAMLDLMALQIRTRLLPHATPEEKIQAINHFVFEEMHFRFPPHSIYAKDIDLYTFLPSVLDSRRGVCLGVSILYICLAQRLGLSLEMITPPGHIYVRYRNNKQIINIETTARGVDLNTEDYLGIDTRSLTQRSIKDIIGLAYFNQASTYWHNENYEKAITAYKIALNYLPNDHLVMELLGYNYLFAGDKEKGEAFLEKVKDYLPDHAISKQTIAEDYLNGNGDIEGIKAVFMTVNEDRNSILKKKEALEKAIQRKPFFRAGYFALATTWLQLNREGEALNILKKFHKIDNKDPTAEYYLSVLYAQRLDYNKAWEHLKQVEALTAARQHYPKVLRDLRQALERQSPE